MNGGRPVAGEPFVIAQNIRSGEFLHWELPVDDLEIVETLSGPQQIIGRFPTEITDLRDVNLEAWGTWIHVEIDGIIRASGILLPSEIDENENLTLDAVGPSGYAKGIPYVGAFTLSGTDPESGESGIGVGLDPADIVRAIWEEIQRYPDGDIGVTVVGATDVKIGTPARDVSFTAGGETVDSPVVVAAKAILARAQAQQQMFEDLTWAGAPQAVFDHNDEIIQAWDTSGEPDLTMFLQQFISAREGTGTTTGGEDVSFVAGPYSALDWWEAKDCGSEIDELAKSTPFDYIERQAWNAGRTGVDHWIELGYPRIGRRRDDIRFAQDENIVAAVGPEEPDDRYASEVITLGRGEGSARVRGYAGRPLGTRLRRPTVVDDKTIENTADANAEARVELESRQALADITELVVAARHPNATLGEYGVGDEAVVEAVVPWAGDLRLWQRILRVAYSPLSEQVKITCRSASSFIYGGGSASGQ